MFSHQYQLTTPTLRGSDSIQTCRNVVRSLCSIATVYRTYPYYMREVLDNMVMGRPISYVFSSSVYEIQNSVMPMTPSHVVLSIPKKNRKICFSVENIEFFRFQIQKSADFYFKTHFPFLMN